MAVVKNPLANTGDKRDASSISGWELSSGVGNGNLLQYSCLEESMNRGSWQATVYRVAKSWTQLNKYTHSMFASAIKTV